MLKVKGNHNLIRNILRIKGIPFEQQEQPEPSIETQGLELNDLATIIQYLDERYPIPQIISGDVENRARIREISSTLMQNPEHCDTLAQHANPFVFGPTVTLVDLVVLEHTNNEPFKRFINKIIHGTENEGW